MSKMGILEVEKRENPNSRSSRRLRKEGYLPGSISSRGKDSVSVVVKTDELRRSLLKHGRNALFNIKLGDKDVTGMVKDIQLSPVKGTMLHVDLQEVSLSEEIRVDISVIIVGSEALESLELMAIRQLDDITVRGLPLDIPDNITIDISKIDQAENVCLKDISFPEGIVPEGDPEQVIVAVVEAKMLEIEEDEDLDEDIDVEVEVIGQETEEEE